MPVHRTTVKGKPAYQWGNQKKYIYTAGNKKSRETAKDKAEKQGRAIEHSIREKN